jgi:diguanylate cyclase (GGDEF)-like protein
MTDGARHRWHWALGLALTASAIGAAWWALSGIGERLMLRGAAQIAQGHAQFVRESIDGFDALLDGAEPDAVARRQLQRAQRWGEVRGLALYGRDGTPRAEPLAPRPLPARVLEGQPQLAVRHTREQGERVITVHAFVPVVSHERVIGAIGIEIDHSARFARMREAMAQASLVICALLAALSSLFAWQFRRQRGERVRSDARARWLADHDALSGAANRSGLQAALAQLDTTASGAALLAIDLDRFAEINDAHGHAIGDAVLRLVAERLQALLRQHDLLARMGGDEFAVLQRAVGNAEGAASLAQRIVEALAAPFEVEGRRIVAGASVGAALTGADYPGAAELLRQADMALARAKAQGAGCFSFYDPALDRQVEERRTLAHELREAAAAGVLQMHYQPILAADGASLLGYEALMRWPHAARGMVPPGVFIPLAEATGQIETLGAFALERACAEAVQWPGALAVSVNLSAAQFRDGDALVAHVQHCLARSGLAPERLVLEITESLLMSDVDMVVRTLNALALMHVQIAMDDFGTGYSSLGSLWRFPFGKVKIDRAFVKDLEHDDRVALVVRSIVSLAHSLAMRVTAEGVETARQAAMLRRLGCDELQGFLFGRPAAADALTHGGAASAMPSAPQAPGWGELVTRPAAL